MTVTNTDAPNYEDVSEVTFDIVIEEIPEPEPEPESEAEAKDEVEVKFDPSIIVDKKGKDEEEEEEIILTVEIESISNLGIVTIPFSHPVIVPEHWRDYTEEELLVKYI